MTIKPIKNDHSGEWHQEKFIEFAKAKDAIGEPTPHMRVVDYLSWDAEDDERIWRAGAYLTAYSVLTGEAIWNEWPYERARQDQDGLTTWVSDNWPGFHTRKPRRCVRTPQKFSRCLVDFMRWMETDLPRLRAEATSDSRADYDTWWESANGISFFGRYISIRLLELMRRWKYMNAHLYDIRAVGAHSPIRCLMLLRPDRIDELATGEQKVVDYVGTAVKDSLGVDISWFTYATLLCEYRSCYEDRSDYAGNQHDEELEYSLSRYAEYWKSQGRTSRLYEARANIDPHFCLGEIQGWSRRRTDVAAWLHERGIVWNDLLYDYKASIASNSLVKR